MVRPGTSCTLAFQAYRGVLNLLFDQASIALPDLFSEGRRWQLQIHWPLFEEAGPQAAVDLEDCILWGEASKGEGELLHADHRVVVIAINQGVMQKRATLHAGERRRACNNDYGDALRIRSGNAVNGAELAHAIRNQESGDAGTARIAFGRVGAI